MMLIEIWQKKFLIYKRERRYNFFLHTKIEIARKIGCQNIHLSIPVAKRIVRDRKKALTEDFVRNLIPASMEDVKCNGRRSATQIILGTIFETECKKIVPEQGVGVCQRNMSKSVHFRYIRYRRNECKAASCHRHLGSCRLLHDVWIYANNETIAIKCFHNMTCQHCSKISQKEAKIFVTGYAFNL